MPVILGLLIGYLLVKKESDSDLELFGSCVLCIINIVFFILNQYTYGDGYIYSLLLIGIYTFYVLYQLFYKQEETVAYLVDLPLIWR